MENIINKSRICPFCGKIINYKIVENDGRDWMGHQRGTPSTKKVGYDCDCTVDKYKKMCINCSYYINNECINKDMINKYNLQLKHDMFDVEIVNSLKIKDVTKSCEFWNLHNKIGNLIFK